MKKTIEELLSGNFRHEHPQLLFSQDKIEVTLKAGDVYKGELYFGTEDNQKIRGYITSSNRRVVPGTEKFSGTTVRLQYGDRKSTRLNSSHNNQSRMPSSA